MIVAVFDSETTGLPTLRSQDLFRAVEVAAVCVDTETCTVLDAAPFHALIETPDAVLDHPLTQDALGLAGGMLREEVREGGLRLSLVVDRWARWCREQEVEGVAAFNYTFDANACPWVVGGEPGVEVAWIRCLMRWGLELIKDRTPAYSPLQRGPRKGLKLPKAGEMAAWCVAQGFPVRDAVPEHRALPDALREADLLAAYLALDPEGLTWADGRRIRGRG